MSRWIALIVLAWACSGCGSKDPDREKVLGPEPATATRVTLSVVGTNDLHGHLERLPVLGGYLANLREARAASGGAVVLVDAGDMFQGTLASNLAEGAPVIDAYEHLGYDAATIGNHEFDFGPVGEPVTATEPSQDPRGALRARAEQADFPLLMANIVDAETGELPDWKNVRSRALLERAGVKVGIIGVTTMSTPHTTLSANFAGLEMRPIAAAIEREAAALREAGAQVIVVTAHAGGACSEHNDPSDLSTCRTDEEIFQVARALPDGAVDVIVAGHTHQAIAHRASGIPIIESYAYGSAFGRVDLDVEIANGATRVRSVEIHPPQDVCRDRKAEVCEPHDYQGAPVTADADLAKLLEPAFARARALEEKPLGVELAGAVKRSYREPSALGNLFADLMLAARPKGDVAIMNGGGLRADLPAGPLTYGELHTAMPFDNRFAEVTMTGAQLAEMIAGNLGRGSGIFSIAGVRATAACEGGELEVKLTRNGRPLPPAKKVVVVLSDFMATGGDGIRAELDLAEGAVDIDDSGPLIRDEMARILGDKDGPLDPKKLHDPSAPRIRFPGKRPVRCGD